jgi:hypothetical protein
MPISRGFFGKGEVSYAQAPVIRSSPVIGGAAQTGVARAYTAGVFAGTPAPTVARQWLLDGSAIAGATGLTYTPAAGDAGTGRLSIRETGSNQLGSISATSAAVDVNAAPAFTSAPVILGTPTVGTQVSYLPGTATGYPAPSIARQWLLDGIAISGATSTTYTPVAGDVGSNRLSIRETATNSVSSASSTSASASVASGSPAPPAGTITSLALTSVSGGTNLPFTYAHVFKEGDVTAPSALGGDTALQVVVKNSWPDGSAKIAILSGTKTLAANTPANVAIQTSGTVAAGASLTTADLKATGITANIDFGAFGAVNWATTDWDSPLETWISGPAMSSWRYRKAIGSDAHLVGWLELRLYAGGAVEVLPWIENGYLNVAGPTSKAATATFTLGGTQRYTGALTLCNHQRVPLASGTTFTHWLGTDPQITPKHDGQYLMDTKLWPKYMGVVASNSSVWSVGTAQGDGAPITSYTPLAKSNFHVPMGEVGYQDGIGMLPLWDVLYLTSGADSRAYRNLIVQGYCHGRYGIHFRDESTNKPPSFASWPNLVLAQNEAAYNNPGSSATNQYTPATSGTQPDTHDLPHHPSVGYTAYVLTGWKYFLEEMQFICTSIHLRNDSTGRQGSKGILLSEAGSNIPRGAAWGMRTLAQTACITPDADPLRTQFVSAVNENIHYYYTRYAAVPGHNPLAFVAPYDHLNDNTPSLPWQAHLWQDDYFSIAYGICRDLKVATAQPYLTELVNFLSWKYQTIAGRMGAGGATESPFNYGAAYSVNIAPRNDANYDTGAGPWYADWRAEATSMGYPTGAPGNTLQGTSGSDPAGMDHGYWGYTQAALAYATDHNAVGAYAGWGRLTGATNWASGAVNYNDNPVWGVKPRFVPPYKSAIDALAVNQSTLIGPAGGAQSVRPASHSSSEWEISLFWSYGGGVVVPDYSKGGAYVLANNGGHGNPSNFGICAFDFEDATWKYRDNANGHPNEASSVDPSEVSGIYQEMIAATGTLPCPTHCYRTQTFLPGVGRKGTLMTLNRGACTTNPTGSNTSHRLDLDTGLWTRTATGQFTTGGGVEGTTLYDPVTNRWYAISIDFMNYTTISYLRGSDMTWQNQNLANGFADPGFSYPTAGLHLDKRMIVIRRNGVLQGVNLSTFAVATLTQSGTAPANQNALIYHPFNKKFYVKDSDGGNTLFVLTPPAGNGMTGTWTWSQITIGGAGLPTKTSPQDGANHYTCLQYVPSLGMLAWVAGADKQVALIKV